MLNEHSAFLLFLHNNIRSLTRAGEKEALGQPSRPARSESVRGRGLFTSRISNLLIVNNLSIRS